MNTVVRYLRLTVEQKHLIFAAVREGKRKMNEYKQLLPRTTTETYPQKLLYDLVNTEVDDAVKNNPHLQLTVTPKKAAFHPYITVHDQARNVFILVLKLPKNKHIFPESRYRGEFAALNFDRLIAEGASLEELASDDFVFQPSLLFEGETHPYCIIVGYDGISDYIFEGALHPDQSEWIYKDDLTDLIPLMMDNVIPFKLHNPSESDTEAKPALKPEAFDKILVKLKDNPKDS